jgi:hypothetical protein
MVTRLPGTRDLGRFPRLTGASLPSRRDTPHACQIVTSDASSHHNPRTRRWPCRHASSPITKFAQEPEIRARSPELARGGEGKWPHLSVARRGVPGGFGRVIPRRCRWGRGRSRSGGLRLCVMGPVGRRCGSEGCGRASTTSRSCQRRCSAAGRSGSWSIAAGRARTPRGLGGGRARGTRAAHHRCTRATSSSGRGIRITSRQRA